MPHIEARYKSWQPDQEIMLIQLWLSGGPLIAVLHQRLLTDQAKCGWMVEGMLPNKPLTAQFSKADRPRVACSKERVAGKDSNKCLPVPICRVYRKQQV